MSKTSDSQKTVIRALGREGGMALISVLWVLVLLTAIVAEFAHAMRTEVNIARTFRDAAQAHYIAHSGVIRSVLEMIRRTAKTKDQGYADEATEGSVWRVNAPIPPQPFGSGEFSVHIDNAAGLIDLNSASEKLLRLMVNTLGISDSEKAVIVDSILDWRDSDDFHRLHGAENSYYQSLSNPYACKNGAFDSVEELLLVRGVSPALFHEHLKSIVTVTPDSKQKATGKGRTARAAARRFPDQININAAPRRLLEALPQVTPQQVQALIDYRISADFISLEEIGLLMGSQTFSAISPYITLSLSPYYTIRAEGRVTGSSVKQTVKAVVQVDGALPGGYRIVSRQNGYY